jgi:PAS domain S-box-containing protein
VRVTEDDLRPPGSAAQELLAAIVDSSDDAILSKTLDGVITSWNIGAERMYGYTADEAVGSSVDLLVPDDLRDELRQILERLGRGERIEHIETRRVRKDGTELEVSLTISPVRDSEGRVVGASAIARDITAARLAAQRLREQAHVLEIINRITATLAGELELEKLVQAVTDAGTELTGARLGAFFYNVDDGAGGSYKLYTLSGESREQLDRLPMPRNTALFGVTFRGEGTVRLDDVRRDPRFGANAPFYGLPEGHPPVVSYLAVPVVSRSGEVIGGLFFGHPDPGVFSAADEVLVTGIAAQAAIAIDNARLFEEARNQAEQLAEADRRKNEFIAQLGHELRNPLAAITSALPLLAEQAAGAAGEPPPAVAILERQTRQMIRLVNDLLDVARISRGQIELRCERLDLRDAVSAATRALRSLIDARSTGVEVSLPDHPVPMDADPVRLEQVISNLLANAARFSEPGGRTWVTLTVEGGEAVLAVRDEGIGIPREALSRIFELFDQGPRPSTAAPGGLGIGLTLVRKLVELHNGTVHAESAGSGRGSTFVVRLPLADRAAEPAPAEPRRAATLPRELPLSVLVVDDHPDAAAATGALLDVWGYEVRTVHDGEAALAAVAERPPRVVLLDIGLPGLDGWEVARRLRQRHADEPLTLVALTGYGQQRDHERSRDAGIDHHLVKPVEPANLRRLLDAIA